MISLNNFASKTKAMGSSFMKNIYIFNIFHHLRAVNKEKAKYEKGKILAPGELSLEDMNDVRQWIVLKAM